MDIREVETVTSKAAYADLCIYSKQLEAINIPQLYRAMTSYLSILVTPSAESYLNIYQEHLFDPYSWLSKAECVSQAEAQREFAREQARIAGEGADQALWDDAAKKLNYLIESWNADVVTACQQIYQGISMLINENIPLKEVQGEIIDFAEGRGVLAFSAEGDVTARLKHLLSDAWVNSVTTLVKLARTVTVQAELFLNRLSQTETGVTQLDVRQSFMFETNHKLCAYINKQSQDLREVVNNFPIMLTARIVKRLEKISVETVLQHYNDSIQPMTITPEALVSDVKLVDDKVDHDVLAHDTLEKFNDIDEFPEKVAYQEDVFQREEYAIPPASSVISSVGLEQMLASNEKLLETVVKQISLHRLQLSCSSRIKACYGRFSLYPLFRQIATKLSHHQKTLANSLSELTNISEKANLEEEHGKKFQSVAKALKNSSVRIGTYLNTLDVNQADYSVTEELPGWQLKLHDLILYSSEEELLIIDSKLQRIEALNSPYLRATLIMKLHVAKLKLNDMIIANMQSWSSRVVDRATVENTLNYLGIRVQPHHLNKIAPNIRVIKRKADKKKDFYSSAADFGLMAFRNVRAWLDKRVII